MSENTEEQQALKAAEEHVLGINVDLTRYDLLQGWFGQDSRPLAFLEELAREDEDFQKMQFSKDNHLVCGIKESRVISYDPDDEAWHVGITLYSGSYVMDEGFWIVYQADNGDWIVEGE